MKAIDNCRRKRCTQRENAMIDAQVDAARLCHALYEVKKWLEYKGLLTQFEADIPGNDMFGVDVKHIEDGSGIPF